MHDIKQHQEDRGFKARRTGIWGVIYQCTYAIVQLLCLGILIRYVGKEQYGLWMTVLAASAWMTLTNLGQTSAMLTKLGAVALTNPQAAQRIFSASVFLVTSIATILCLCLAITWTFLPWAQLFDAKANMTNYAVGSIVVAGLLISLLAFPAGLGSVSIFAHQRGDIVHMVMVGGSLLSLIFTGLAVFFHLPLWVVGSITLSGPFIGGVALWFIGIANGLVPLPKFRMISLKLLREMTLAGSMFFLIDATTLLLLRAPDLIVAQINGISSVGPFASVGRLPLLMIALFQALLLPFWPALSEAANKADYGWIQKIVIRTLIIVFGLWSIGATGIWFLGPWFIHLWTGSSDFSSTSLIGAACIQSLGLGLYAWLSVLLSGLSQQRMLLLISILAALVFLSTSLYFGNRFGSVGVALAQAATMLFCITPLGIYTLHKILRDVPRRVH